MCDLGVGLCSRVFDGFLISAYCMPGTGLDLRDKTNIPPPFRGGNLVRERHPLRWLVDVPGSKISQKGDGGGG